MRVVLDDFYELEINARRIGLCESPLANDKDTMNFLNQLAIWVYESAERNISHGYVACAEQAAGVANQLHETLEGMGFYSHS